MQIPLCVDLDGTLVRTDMLHETLLLLMRAAPLSVATVPGWLAGGKARFKHRVAERVEFDPATLPYRAEVLDLIHAARAEGRPVILVTAASARVAAAIAAHLDLFDDVLSSDETVNLASHDKAGALVKRFGARGFDYIGNHDADLPIFAKARHGILVSSAGRLRKAAAVAQPDMHFIDAAGGGVRAWMKALRVHQWLKNGLIFVPLLAAHAMGDLSLLLATLLAFISFSLCASSVYILNDLLDLTSDRRHHSKRRRPFASGALPVSAGIIASPLLLAASLSIGAFLPPTYLFVLVGYGVITTLYSFKLKRQVIVDVMLLAALYTVRILAGAAATGIKPSFWLLAFSMFIFLCLAMVKRYSELRLAVDEGKLLDGRGYRPSDLPVVLALGVGSGLVAVLILAMYTQAQIVPEIYPAGEWLWLVPPLMLYWVARLWLKAGRGEVDDDPVLFAIKDWQSLTVITLMGAAFILAGSGWLPY